MQHPTVGLVYFCFMKMFHVYSSCLLIIDLQIQPQQPSLTCFFWSCIYRSIFDDASRVLQRISAGWGCVCSRLLLGGRRFLEDQKQLNMKRGVMMTTTMTHPYWGRLNSLFHSLFHSLHTQLCVNVFCFLFFQESFCNRPLSLKYQTKRKNTWTVQWSNLKFGDRRDDRGLGFEVGQVHGSGEQQQRWRNIFFQVQVKPLDGGQHLLQTDNRTTCSDYINSTKKNSTDLLLLLVSRYFSSYDIPVFWLCEGYSKTERRHRSYFHTAFKRWKVTASFSPAASADEAGQWWDPVTSSPDCDTPPGARTHSSLARLLLQSSNRERKTNFDTRALSHCN